MKRNIRAVFFSLPLFISALSSYHAGAASVTGAAAPGSGAAAAAQQAWPPAWPLVRQVPVPPPPMGWASWNGHGCNINEKVIHDAADYLVSSGLKSAGYVYVNVDDCWSELTRDSQGKLNGNHVSFPSGMSALGDYIHSKGLKYGIYATPGLRTCAQLNNLQNELAPGAPGNEANGNTGSQGHEALDAATFVQWGVDYLKYDWCTKGSTAAPAQVPVFAKMRDALRQAALGAGRKGYLFYSINPDSFNDSKTGRDYDWGNVADMWRTEEDISYDTGDNFTPGWSRLVGQNFEGNVFPEAQHTGRYNDPDMMLAGMGLSDEQDRSHIALWAISGAPMILGNDFTGRPPKAATLALLKNPEMIAIDQDGLGLQGVLVANPAPGVEVWAKPLMGNGRRAVLLFNNSTKDASMAVSWRELGLEPLVPGLVRDVWARANAGIGIGRFETRVPAGTSRLYVIQGADTAAVPYRPSAYQPSADLSSCGGCEPNAQLVNPATVSFDNVVSQRAGGYLQIAYQNTGSEPVDALLSVNGGPGSIVSLPPTGAAWGLGGVSVEAALKPGRNSVVLAKWHDPSAALSIQRVAVVAGPLAYRPPRAAYEAESPLNTLSGQAAVYDCASCSGGKKVGYIGQANTLSFNQIAAPKAGAYSIDILYGNGEPNGRNAQVSVNGGTPVTLALPSTGSYDTIRHAAVTVNLQAGSRNTLTISNPSDWAPDIDAIGWPTPLR